MWGSRRQRNGHVKEINPAWYSGPQGAELLGAHVTEVVQNLMRGVAATGEPFVIDSLRVTVEEDYGEWTIEATVTTMRERN